MPQQQEPSSDAATTVEALGGNFVNVAAKMREAAVDLDFLRSLTGQDLEETLADLGVKDRLSRRRLVYALKLEGSA